MKNIFLNTVPSLLCALVLLGSTPILHAQSNNNMGIGTTSPDASAILDIKSTTKGLLIPRLTQGQENALSGPSGLLIYNSDQGRFNFYNGGWKPVGLWSLNGSSAFYSAGNVKTTGNLLLNNASPTLYLQDTDNKSGMIHQNSNRMFFLTGSGNNSTTWAINGSYWPLTLNMTNDAATFGGPAYFMEGKVGIGTTNPLSKLSISPSATEPKITLWDGGSTTAHYGFGVSSGQLNYHVAGSNNSHVFYAGGKNGNGAQLMRIWGNGDVDIARKLEVAVPAGDFNAAKLSNNSPSVGGISFPTLHLTNNSGSGLALFIASGTAAKPGGGSWLTSSDLRLKKDIEGYAEGLESIRQVRPVWYRYNGKGGLPIQPRYVGVIAQELQKIAPYMVTISAANENPEKYLMVDPSNFTYMLINSVKELDETVQTQQQKIEAQQAEIDAIKKALAKAGIKLD